MSIKEFAATIFFLMLIYGLYGQTDNVELEEGPNDPYVYTPRSMKSRSLPYQYSNGNIRTVQVNVDNMGNNIIDDAANETSIAIDPTSPLRMVIGWRQFDNIDNNFRQAGFAYTTNGGASWTFPGPIDPGIFRSDPVLDFDAEGNFYYNSLRAEGGDFWCEVFRSTGDGTWGEAVFAHGGDKQWMVVDRTEGVGKGNVYAFWNPNVSSCDRGFTRSRNQGDSYEECTSIDRDPAWGTMSVGPDGDLFATGRGNIVSRSTNAQSNETINWEHLTDVDLGGSITAFNMNSPNPVGLLGQQWIVTDHSDQETRGNVYMLASVQTPAGKVDVRFSRSEDNGLTWSDVIQINEDDTGANWNWMGTMSVAPNGRIDVVWLDTRDNPGTYLSSLYYSFSMDAGNSWSINQRLSEEFDPHVGWPNQNKMGDYFEMISVDEGAHLAWAGTFNGEQDVYYSFIAPLELTAVEILYESLGALEQNYPNPFHSQTSIPFTINQNGLVEIEIVDLSGKQIDLLVNKQLPAGTYSEIWDRGEGVKEASSGVYYYNLKLDGKIVSHHRMAIF